MGIRAYVGCAEYARSTQRIIDGLTRYSPPGIQIVDSIDAADFVVLHAFGRFRELRRLIKSLKQAGKRYGMIQYCIRRTLERKTSTWRQLWDGAEVLYSYLDLQQFVYDDGEDFQLKNFYHAPLGTEFTPLAKIDPAEYVIASSGGSWLHESVRECVYAAERTGRKVFHVGPVLTRKYPFVDWSNGMDDQALAEHYRRCDYVAGLRHTEGFEIPVVEGLLCGARPVVFDAPHYRHWFEDFAVFIPETGRDVITDNLARLFAAEPPAPVSVEEKARALQRFNWTRILRGFWERVL